MASPQSPTEESEQGSPKENEELTREKIIVKYKTLMALTNKIKTARNDALAENSSLKEQIDVANEKIKTLAQQNATAEEMLAALTDQKLKMAMEMDDMKKEKQLGYDNMRTAAYKEIEVYKLENNRIKSTNDDLLIQLKEKDQKEIQLQNDLKKLHENNENIIILCSNIRQEKLDIQNKLEEVQSKYNKLVEDKKYTFELISKQFNKHFEDISDLKKFLELEIKGYCKYQCAEEINVILDQNLNLKNQVEVLNNTSNSLLKEKECVETNLFNVSTKLEKLKSELSAVTSDRDQILNNLENVRLETKNLIENSEKLADELEVSKTEKNKNNHEMNLIINNKNEEIERLQNICYQLKQQIENLNTNILSQDKEMMELKTCDSCKESCNKSDSNINDSYKNRISLNINKLSQIKTSFANITESIQNINITLLQKQVQLNETDLLGISAEPPGEQYLCSNIKCNCNILKQIGIQLNENIQNYDKVLIGFKHDLDIIRQQFDSLLNKEKTFEKQNEEILLNIFKEKQCWSDDQNLVLENIKTKMEEYFVLNNLLENKILVCREELGCALVQLHNAEELEETLQREIHILKKQLHDVITEREKLNEIITDKVDNIKKIDKELIIEKYKSTKLLSDLELIQIELNETKKSLNETGKNIESIELEKNDLTEKITEISDKSQKLMEENDSLKLNIKNILQEEAENKFKEKEDSLRLIFDLGQSNELLNKELEETNKNYLKKISNFKKDILVIQNESCILKKQLGDLKEFMLYSAHSHHDNNQEITKLFHIQAGEILKIDQINQQVIQKQDSANDTEGLNISQEENISYEKQVLTENINTDVIIQFVDKECQVDEQQFENVVKKEIPHLDEMEDTTDYNAAKIQSLETSLALSKQELVTANLEVNQLREEFHSYRLRAQSLLSKQKGELVSQREKEAKELVEKLNDEIECLRSKMEIIILEDETIKSRLSTLLSEKDIIDKKYDDISRALHQKIIDYDTLNTEYNAFKLSTDTLIHNGKILLEEKYKCEITTKEGIINKLKSELKERQMVTSEDKNIEELEYANSIHNIEEILQEREEGEGSETAATPFNEGHEFVPLDVLINDSVDGEENQVALLHEQVNMLSAELSSHGIRSKHLSSLLREAEKESARNAQQNDVLKEEVRRLERCLERQPLVANTEYLKNVVFKFLTLASADERSRLVPVLDSILKLSPTEAQKLNEIARGEGNSRWSNYLHSWTGLG